MPISNEQQTLLLNEIQDIVGSNSAPRDKLSAVCGLLKDRVPYYDWVGFYLVNSKKDQELVLGPYTGEPTEHTKIPFGRGICGQAAEIGETIIVSDVMAESNYLACNINVKSEIVVPIYHEGVMLGQIDIDSHTTSAFDESDRALLEMVGCLVMGLLH
jgi:L-methionine (R)-S-oxide reductase